jgi:mRNA-degrading endonuclease RelE of RelBE toxin-antitoxin system
MMMSEKLPDAIYIIKELSSLSESTHLKKLKGEENGFRYKVGSYRIILR